MKTPDDLLDANLRWADGRRHTDANFFRDGAKGQTPNFLWVGCADSRVSAEVIAGLEPGEALVHRNIANLIQEGDVSALSVLELAIDLLAVEHIIICGHEGCAGAKLGLEDGGTGAIRDWLAPVRKLADAHRSELVRLTEPKERLDHFCEVSTMAQVDALCRLPVLQRAWQAGQAVTVHAWFYDLSLGRLRDLNYSKSGPADG